MFSLLLPLLFISAATAQFTFLTEQDFSNALFVQSSVTRRVRSLFNDQRFGGRRLKRGGVAVASDRDKWPNGRIPYILSAAYTDQQRAVIAKAIIGYNQKTCIRFVPKTSSDKDYIVISKLDGCYADFARVGGRQQVSLADECIDYATIIHELMHVIGFIHEHQREDRDGFVSILWQNVIPGADTDFAKLSNLGLSYYGENYDYLSIMHYESNEGSRNGKNTIEAKDTRFTPVMGRSTDFSASDLRRVNRAYSCTAYLRNKGM